MSDVTTTAKRIIANVEKVVVGKRRQIILSLVAWFCEGHILLEDVPGVAKTVLARALARQYTPQQLVRYSFEALEAWAREQGCPREADQTPREFARQVAARNESLSGGAKKLAGLYSQVAYASGRPSTRAIAPLEDFWRQLRSSAAPAQTEPRP